MHAYEHERKNNVWFGGNQYLRAWEEGAVPWQYGDMPRGQVLSRSLFNERVAAAVRLVQHHRHTVLGTGPDGAQTCLSDDEFTRAWEGAREEFRSIWARNCPGTSSSAPA